VPNNKVLARFWAVLFLVGFAVFPLLQEYSNGILGAGPDVVSTLWGMWWFQEESAAFFGSTVSTLANYPNGVVGVVLSPSSAIVWAITEPWFGVDGALLLVVLANLFGFMSGVWAILSHQTDSFFGACLGTMSLLVGCHIYYSIGEASIISIAVTPLVWGLYFVLKSESGEWYWSFSVLSMMMWTALENPYLAPVLPIVLLFLSVTKPTFRFRMLLTTVLGVLGIVWIASVFKGAANPDYPKEVAGQAVVLFGRSWEIIDLPWSRLQWWEVFWPQEVQWSVGADDAREATGGRYLGLSVVAIGLVSLVYSKMWRWLAFGLIAYWLTLGSVHFERSGLFLFLNGIMDAIARPLTQPTRYLVLFQIAVAVGVAKLAKSAINTSPLLGVGIAVVFFIDATVWGGLSLDIPRTELPDFQCQLEGPILMWPWDASDGAQSETQLYQIQHHQPSPHTAIASWAISGERVLNDLRASGFRLGSDRLNMGRLRQLGYRWVVVEGDTPSWADKAQMMTCGDLVVVGLQ
jgi:hypothetical protein